MIWGTVYRVGGEVSRTERYPLFEDRPGRLAYDFFRSNLNACSFVRHNFKMTQLLLDLAGTMCISTDGVISIRSLGIVHGLSKSLLQFQQADEK